MFAVGDIFLIKDDKESILDNAIRGASGGNFGHTACVVEKDKTVFEMLAFKGAVLNPIEKYFDKRYTTLVAHPLFLTDEQQLKIKNFLIDIESKGVKYDYRGVIGQLFKVPDKINNPDRLYCSEAVAWAYWTVCSYLFSGLYPPEQAPKDQGFHVISCQHDWQNRYIRRHAA